MEQETTSSQAATVNCQSLSEKQSSSRQQADKHRRQAVKPAADDKQSSSRSKYSILRRQAIKQHTTSSQAADDKQRATKDKSAGD